MPRQKDWVTEAYEKAILQACWNGDSDLAYEHSIGLQQYRELYQDRSPT